MEAKAQFTAEEVNKAIENTYKDISKKANIKGFRKGKVPRRMLELYFPKDAACAETLEKLLGDAIDNMVEEFELKLIADPDLKPEPLKENEPYEFTVTFEVTPEVTLSRARRDRGGEDHLRSDRRDGRRENSQHPRLTRRDSPDL